jgi:hypothetical protein
MAADFVEVHLRRWPPMKAPLDSRKKRERRDSAFTHAIGHPSFLEDAHHVWERPYYRVIADFDDGSRCGDAISQHGLEPE